VGDDGDAEHVPVARQEGQCPAEQDEEKQVPEIVTPDIKCL